MRNYQKEFPHFAGVEMPTFDGFEDTSWHNDACPSFERYLAQELSLRVWVDHPDENLRDAWNSSNHRYALDLMHGCECVKTIIITDDLEQVRLEIKKFEEVKQ